MRALDPRLLRRARAARTLLAVDVALGLVTTAAVLAQASLLAWVIAQVFDGASARECSGALVALALLGVLRGAVSWGTEVAGRSAASAVLSELRRALLRRRLTEHPEAVDGTEAAEVVAAAVGGVDALGAYFARYLPQLVLACVVPVAVVVYVATIDLESALIMVLTLPLVPVFMVLIGLRTKRHTEERWAALVALSSHFLDVLRGLPTLRAFDRARGQTVAIAAVGDRHRRATMATLRVSFLSGSVLELAATLGVALVAVIAGVRLVDGSLGLQAGLTVLILAPELYLPLRRLGAEFHASADGLAVAQRMLALLEAPGHSSAAGVRYPPNPRRAPVRLQDVSFAYPTRPGLVLDRVDLELAPDETLALVGESGAGKSTVAALVLGLLRPTAGRVTVGGVDLARCRRDAWLRQLAWVPQHPALLPASVADNIRLGDRSASDAAVRDAATLAGADRFVRALPDGYATVVGDGGRPLSAGQLRRVALARAFLRDAALVVLDEPTADLDPLSVDVVGEAVARLGARGTVLVIAHRPELIVCADRVIHLPRPGGDSVLAPTA
ncbi:ATP-binding/permease protein CydD [Baekduia alba]|uniref:thiol reductant ABC exporter subunit CydD n=1 Tax=Baekduia alba TaxID=2997333 RepID=UPI002341F198|nr:thiol reductant ABC exporter subunit CydD [Baekduia alba]WCB95183.1 ATP-binding/permease protein CydD [Baekduia alba]